MLKQRDHYNEPGQSRILLAVIGNSPAVLTETVWSLAHQELAWIPDRVVAITTQTGKRAIQDQLVHSKGWDELVSVIERNSASRGKLLFGASDSIRVIGDGNRDFPDIVTLEESEVAADFILGVVRQYTEQPGTEIIASIAGGRKTMSALLLACMSLLGREQDRVCHVLAHDEFICKNPDFLFPKSKREERTAGIRLHEIPFVRMRGWYEQESRKQPASYSHMVSLFRSQTPPAIVEMPVVLDCERGQLLVDGADMGLTPIEFAVALTFIRDRTMHPDEPSRIFELTDGVLDVLNAAEHQNWCERIPRSDRQMEADDFRKVLARVRAKVRGRIERPLADRLLPDARKRYRYQSVEIRRGRPKTS